MGTLTRMHASKRTLTALTICLALVGVSCGGDSGSGSAALSDEEFCLEVAALDGMNPDVGDMAEIVTTIEDLAAKAPSDELRDAMLALVPVMTMLSEIDENDPEAMNKVMEVMMDPEVMAAGELIEKYSSETCGIDDSAGDESSSGSSDTMPTEGSNGAYIFDDIEAGDISDYVEANGTDYFPNGYVNSTSMSGADGYTEVIMDFADADSVDGVSLCEVIFEGIAMSTADTAVRIVVQQDTVDIAVREVDGECSAV
ncbi:unannotated protein [freshwater metagenome]|uniref:Unannotated protein n=1 Tax=freshwater metagenome TaxID=449393 RepID=A0A6J6F4B8_9ZZZZ